MVKADSSVIQPSRLGFRGVEDLGGGNSTLFVLESGYDINSGSLGQGSTTGLMFGRQAYVGLRNNEYGTVTIGRQYEFIGDTLVFYDFTDYAGVYAFHRGDNDRLSGQRLNNSVKYLSPTIYGFRVGAMYAFADTSVPQGHATSFLASYNQGPLSVAATYVSVTDLSYSVASKLGITTAFGANTVTKYDPVTGAITAVPFALQYLHVAGVGATYNFEKLSLRGVFTNVSMVAKSNGASLVIRNYDAIVTYSFSPFLRAGFGYTYSDLSVASLNQYNAAIDYFLSKRSDVYMSVSYQRVAGKILNANMLSAANSSDKSQAVVHIGLRHRF